MVVLGGCGGSAPSVSTYHDFSAAQNEILCDTRFKCCTPTQATARFPNQPTAAACTTTLDAQIDTTSAAIEAAIAQGILKYDAAQGADCIAAMSAFVSSCGEPPALSSPACFNVLVGTLAKGATCDGNNPACAPGLYCSTDAPLTGGSGTCLTALTSGQACANTTPCAAGLACLASGMCGAASGEGSACTVSIQCASGVCDANAHTCAAPATIATDYCN